ncbi:L-ascorbate oxidase [Xylariaceae sp. FL0804]|nr:L-ascorbate oxidase [Xylariaceae sp. FL0804]
MKGVSHFVSLLVLRLLLLQTSLAADITVHGGDWTPNYVLVVTTEDININCEKRTSVVFNGTAPGPPLYLKEGKTTWVRVYNHMENDNLTVHWHGLTMRTAPFSDGTPLVSQWPIGPGQFFDYEMQPQIGDSGTYFYHSHVGFQALTAHGIMYVDDAGDLPYQYDEDVPLFFGDHYQATDDALVDGLTGDPFVWTGEPDALTLNGQTGTASFATAADDSCKPFVVTVEPNGVYRLRFVGAGAISYLTVGIEDHTNLTIIAADGYYTKPATTDHIQLGTGQRFDALLQAKSNDELAAAGKDQFWIRYETRGGGAGLSGYALLQYTNVTSSASKRATKSRRQWGRPSAGNSTNFWSLWQLERPYSGVKSHPWRFERPYSGDTSHFGRYGSHYDGHPLGPPGDNPAQPPVSLPAESENLTDWMAYTLESLVPQDFPPLSEVTRSVHITMNINGSFDKGSYADGQTPGTLVYLMNNLSWTETEAQDLRYMPYLVQAYTLGTTPDYAVAVAGSGWDPNTKAFPAKIGETLDIIWHTKPGTGNYFQYHSMHAHGKHYFDLGSGSGPYDAAANEAHFASYTPPRRDTTMLVRYPSAVDDESSTAWTGWRIRVTEENVGAWMMHCHILQHMVMGMQTVWVFGDAAAMINKIPQPYIAGYLQYGGDAYGNDTYDPLVLSWFD